MEDGPESPSKHRDDEVVVAAQFAAMEDGPESPSKVGGCHDQSSIGRCAAMEDGPESPSKVNAAHPHKECRCLAAMEDGPESPSKPHPGANLRTGSDSRNGGRAGEPVEDGNYSEQVGSDGNAAMEDGPESPSKLGNGRPVSSTGMWAAMEDGPESPSKGSQNFWPPTWAFARVFERFNAEGG